MGKYFYLQLKRVLRLLPAVICVVAILFGSLAAVYQIILKMDSQSEDKMKVQVGLVGTAGDTYLELGLAALENFDSSRFAIEIVAMEQQEAKTALNRGLIAAYIEIPEGFMDEAMQGNLMPLKYVSTSGASSVVSMFKDEITMVINDILVQTQKGIYGVGRALKSEGYASGPVVDDISFAYIDFVFDRAKVYHVTELGISDGLGLDGYLLCGLTVLFLLLICLPFGTLFIKRDLSLGKMLSAKHRSAATQVGSEWLAFLTGMAALLTVVMLVLVGADVFSAFSLRWTAVLYALPVLLMVVSFSFLLFEIARDLISGILLHFFLTLALCFVSGCMYPVYFFPESAQKLAAYLPTGLAREQLSGCLTDSVSAATTLALLGCSAVFFLLTVLIRKHRILGSRG